VDDPPGVSLVRLKIAVTSVGRPEVDRSTADLNPAIEVMVMMYVVVSPCSTSLDVGAAAIEKSSTGAGSISMLRLVSLVTPPPDAVSLSVYVPAGADSVVVTSNVDWNVGLDDGGFRRYVAPDGRPERLRLTS
jgi:hypothetical protein